MLLVDFGESTCKFALIKEHERSLDVQTWGIEDIRSFEYAVNHVLESIKGAHEDIGPVLVSLPPTLWRSLVIHERVERKNASVRIDSAEKKSILESLFTRVRASLAKQVQDAFGILAEEIRIQNLQVLKYAIDGYEVQDVLGFVGVHIDVQVMVVFTLVKHMPVVDTILQRFSGALSPRVVHLTQALEGFSKTSLQDAIYIDLGDASCRIIVTQRKRVVFASEIARGGKNFTLYLQETLSLGDNIAKDFKERYTLGDFSFPLREGVKKGFQDIAKDIVSLVCKSLSRVSAAESLPPLIFLFGGASKLPEIMEVFERNAFEDLAFHEKPRISFLLPKDLWNLEFPGKTNPSLTPLFFLPYANKESS